MNKIELAKNHVRLCTSFDMLAGCISTYDFTKETVEFAQEFLKALTQSTVVTTIVLERRQRAQDDGVNYEI